VVVNTRHLHDPNVKATSNQAKGMLIGGVAALAVAMGTFLVTVSDVGKEKVAYEAHLAAGGEISKLQLEAPLARPDAIVFLGIGAGLALIYMGLKRRGVKEHDYVIGADAKAGRPGGREFTGGGAHALVSMRRHDFVVNTTRRCRARSRRRQPRPLQTYIQQRGASFTCRSAARARIDCGETSSWCPARPKPRVLEFPFLTGSGASRSTPSARRSRCCCSC
jgi:hypothetical protein